MRKLAFVLMFVFGGLALFGQGLQNGLLMHYPFDGGYSDVSSYGNNATNSGASLVQDECQIPVQALSVASGTSVKIPNAPHFQVQPPLTISFKVRFTSYNSSKVYLIWALSEPLPSDAGYKGIYANYYNGEFYINLGKSNSYTATGRLSFSFPHTITTNQWYKVTVVLSSLTTMTAQVDCITKTVSISGTPPAFIPWGANQGSIGNGFYPPNGSTLTFDNQIDEFRLWGRALTITERQNLCSNDTTFYSSVSCTPVSIGGQSYAPGTDTVFAKGTCSDEFTAIKVNLPPSDTTTTSAIACPNTPYNFFGQSLLAPDTAYHFNGCDTVFQLFLGLDNCNDTILIAESLCPGTTYDFLGTAYAAPLDTFLTPPPGDTTFHLVLTALPDPITLTNQRMGCLGDQFDTLGLSLTIPYAEVLELGDCDTILILTGIPDPSCKQHCEAFVPNAFTPNGDGLNEFFPPTLPVQVDTWRFYIFNRWGQELYVQERGREPWDGTYQGQEAPDGVYFYRLEYVCGNETLEKAGFVTLMR